MISKNQQKYVQSLHNKKFRQEYQTFLVEGAKILIELLNSDFEIEQIYITETFFSDNKAVFQNKNFELVSVAELEKITTLQSNDAGLAIVKMKPNVPLICNDSEFVLVLDEIKDPGNLGTIIRIADWYGIKKVVCSKNTVELHNPKVISSTMGSFLRTNVFYTDLAEYFTKNTDKSILGAFLDGKNVHEYTFPKDGYLVIGSESHGIGENVEKFVTQKLTIPRFGQAESLNAGIATAILVDNLVRG